MFKQLVKYTLAAVIWKRYRALILATVGLFVYFWVVGRLHGDFLAYVALRSSNENLASSFIIKWLFIGGGLSAYLGFLYFWQREPEERTLPKTPHKTPEASPKTSSHDQKDPFERLRTKTTLKAKGDTVIDRYPKND